MKPDSINLPEGKISLLIDGQFGSTGKGNYAAYTASLTHIDIAISNASANAGHTFYWGGKKHIVKHLPVSGIIHKRCQIYLCAGAIIHPETLITEAEKYNVPLDRIIIHPRAAVITAEDINTEKQKDSSVTKIASTQSGVGSALVRKINRAATLAGDHPLLSPMTRDFDLQGWLNAGATAFMEVPQGLDLSISSGYSYPYCTSREITVSAALADAQVHPKYLGKTFVTLRTYPIRVGNIIDKTGIELGVSGAFYPDSVETSWEALHQPAELTTVTGRIRRVATFSMLQYKRMLDILQPDYILLNFCNYMSTMELNDLLKKLPEITHLGFGPTSDDIRLNN